MAVYKERTDKSGCGGSAEGRQGEEEGALFRKEGDILYDATIVMEDTGGKYVNFKLEFEGKK